MGLPGDRPVALVGADPLASEALTLRLLPTPRRLAATTRLRRGYREPATYRERVDPWSDARDHVRGAVCVDAHAADPAGRAASSDPTPGASPAAPPPAGRRRDAGRPLVTVVAAAGPDRVVVGREAGAPVAREYWQCTGDDGRLALVFREMADPAAPPAAPPGDDPDGVWYLQGWWD